MAFSPNNPTVYLKAMAGALSGMTMAAGNFPTDPTAADYGFFGQMADAYAQQVDTVWGASVPSGFALEVLSDVSQALWRSRSPLSTNIATTPAQYNQVARAVVAIALQGNTQVVGQGVDPNQIGSGTGFLASTWTPVAAGTTVIVVANAMYAVDSTGAAVIFDFPPAPLGDVPALIKLVGSTVAVPVSLVAGAGDRIEDPQNPGTFSAIAGTVAMTVAGSSALYKYQALNKRWIAAL